MPKRKNKHPVDLHTVPRELIQQARPLVTAAGHAVLQWDLRKMMDHRNSLYDLCEKFQYTPEEVTYILEHC